MKEFKELESAITAFKEATDEQISEIKKGMEDVVTKEKVERINEAITKLQDDVAEAQKASLRGEETEFEYEGKKIPEGQKKHLDAFSGYVRKGDGALNGLREAQEEGMVYKHPLLGKDVNITTPGDGGYAIPQVLGRTVMDRLVELSDVRPYARVITVINEDYRELHNLRGTASGWVDEDDARPETGTSTLTQVVPFMGEIYANPAATQTAIEDLFFNVEQWIANEVATEFAYQEGVAFVTGDGSKKPKGFLAGLTAATADATRAFGTIEHFASVGSSKLFDETKIAATDTDGHQAFLNQLFDIEASFKSGFLGNLAVYGKRSVLAKVRKLRDTQGNLIWQPGVQSAPYGTLLGYPVRPLDASPAEGTDALALSFADLSRAYTIVDRVGMSTLRDAYTNKPYVHFYTRKRVGGMLSDSEAIKVIKCTA